MNLPSGGVPKESINSRPRCLHAKAINALGAHTRRRRPTLLLPRCLNTETIGALDTHARGGGVPKESVNSRPGCPFIKAIRCITGLTFA